MSDNIIKSMGNEYCQFMAREVSPAVQNHWQYHWRYWKNIGFTVDTDTFIAISATLVVCCEVLL
jgi:hypothetical protein